MFFQRIQFNNGLRLILVPLTRSLNTTVMVLVEAGSEYETKEINGLSHFLEHMCFKGTTKRPNQLIISSELDSLGAEYNAFTSQEYTGYFAKARNQKLNQLLDIITDLYLNPLLKPEDIEKERGPIIEEINMYEDLPPRKVHDLFLNLVYGDQPAGWDIAGTKENILKFQREDFLAYRDKHYIASKTILVLAGGFSRFRIEEKVQKYFEGIKIGEKEQKFPVREEEQTKPKFLISFKKTDQTHLILGFRAFDIHDERRFALGVLADILGGSISSRLFQKIRSELGAAYYIRATTDLYIDHGLFLISAGINNEKVEDSIKNILQECHWFKENLVSEKELKKSKEHLIGELFLSLETSDELASFYGIQEIVGHELKTPQEIARKIQEVTPEDIRKIAQFLFQENRLNLAMIGPLKDKDFSNILKI